MPRQYTPRVPRICEQCGIEFMVVPSAIARGGGRFCGRACYHAANARGEESERTCTRCGETKPIEQFQRRGEHRVTFCNACHTKRLREKYATDPEFAEAKKRAAHEYRRANPEHVAAKKKEWQSANLDKVRVAVAKSRARYPEKVAARLAVTEAIAAGTLRRESCWCGDTQTDAHHHRGYAPEHWLDVVWLCRRHHAEMHRKYDPPGKQV